MLNIRDIEISRGEGFLVVTFGPGRLDAASTPGLRTQLLAAKVGLPLLVLDMRAVSFVDEVGLGLLVALRRRHGRVTLLGVHPRVSLLLSLMHLQGAFVRAPSLAAALKSCATAPIQGSI